MRGPRREERRWMQWGRKGEGEGKGQLLVAAAMGGGANIAGRRGGGSGWLLCWLETTAQAQRKQ
jgi:hypothetical protein